MWKKCFVACLPSPLLSNHQHQFIQSALLLTHQHKWKQTHSYVHTSSCFITTLHSIRAMCCHYFIFNHKSKKKKKKLNNNKKLISQFNFTHKTKWYIYTAGVLLWWRSSLSVFDSFSFHPPPRPRLTIHMVLYRRGVDMYIHMFSWLVIFIPLSIYIYVRMSYEFVLYTYVRSHHYHLLYIIYIHIISL